MLSLGSVSVTVLVYVDGCVSSVESSLDESAFSSSNAPAVPPIVTVPLLAEMLLFSSVSQLSFELKSLF